MGRVTVQYANQRLKLHLGKFPEACCQALGMPFGRLWWDEIVGTVVTRAEPHNQAILHPEQDRVLTIRENARIQGFPDYYRLFGPVKERYIQVGNAVAIPVAKALGYELGLAIQKQCQSSAVAELPRDFLNNLIVNSKGRRSAMSDVKEQC
eukprot:Gb_03787 [translate_table: standard]